MPKSPQHYVSPNFTTEKLKAPTYEDIVDVFEDRMRHWMLEPAKQLLLQKHGYVAAVSILIGYFEGIEIFHAGEDSDRQSKTFFKRGYKRVFASASGPEYVQSAIAAELYSKLRCGFAHDGLFRNPVVFSTIRKEAFFITWPKKKGAFDPKGKLTSAIVNPHRFCEGIFEHFDSYVQKLRAGIDQDLKRRFLAAIAIKWRLGEPGPYIAITEEAFLRGGVS